MKNRLQYFFQKADVTCSQSISYTLEYSFTLIALGQVFASVQLCGTLSPIVVDAAGICGSGAIMEGMIIRRFEIVVYANGIMKERGDIHNTNDHHDVVEIRIQPSHILI